MRHAERDKIQSATNQEIPLAEGDEEAGIVLEVETLIVKARGNHADNRVADAVEVQSLTDWAGRRAEFTLPKASAD